MTSRILLVALVAIAMGCNKKDQSAQADQTSEPALGASSDLKINELVGNRSLKENQSDSFKLELKKDALVSGYIDQHKGDLYVALIGPNKDKIGQYDYFAKGIDKYLFRTKSDGVYTLVVSSWTRDGGDYSIMLNGAEALSSTPETRVEQVVKAALGPDANTPGVAIAVQKEGKLIYDKGFGNADMEQKAKVTPTTVFHIASVSKQFTAFAIAVLADQGKISLDDDIRKYLPEMHDFGTPITICQLVHHTSGLRDQWNLLTIAGWRMDDVITMPQVMRILSKQTELNFKPGDEHLYCNSGFTLMGEIVHRVTKEPFPVWCKANIFDPLGMKNTLFFDDHEKIVENRAYSYYQDNHNQFKKSVLSYANAGATSLFTTVEDLSLWAQNFETVKVGNENVMNIMKSKYVLNNGDTIAYSFGQSYRKYKGLNAYSHSGGDAGFRSFLLRFPDQHVSISVFSNFAQFPVSDLTYQLADLYLADQMKEEAPKPATAPSNNSTEKETPFDKSTVKLADYTGRYYSPELETYYTLDVMSDTLTTHHQRLDDMKLRPTKPDAFSTNDLGNLEFYREKGKIAGFRVSDGRVRNLKFIRQ